MRPPGRLTRGPVHHDFAINRDHRPAVTTIANDHTPDPRAAAAGMADDGDATASAPPQRGGRWPAVLWVGAVGAVVAAGLVLWADRASAVFVDMLSAAIAWCF